MQMERETQTNTERFKLHWVFDLFNLPAPEWLIAGVLSTSPHLE